jgi:heme-degrading monooxygenase HmoA
MNRFKIVNGREKDFEKIWKDRDTHLDKVNGYREFHLIKGVKEDSFTLYASHTIWDTKDDFVNWTQSDAFRLAHKGAGKHGDMYIGHPVFEGFDVVI